MARNTKKYNVNGKSMTLPEWALELGLAYNTLWNRIARLRWSPEEAITIPKNEAPLYRKSRSAKRVPEEDFGKDLL